MATMNRIPTTRAVALCEAMTALAREGRSFKASVATSYGVSAMPAGQGIRGAAEPALQELLISPR